MLDLNAECVVWDSWPATRAHHGPLGLHSGSRKTSDWIIQKKQRYLEMYSQPLLLTAYLCLTVWWSCATLGCDSFLSSLTEVFTFHLCWMWEKQFSTHRSWFQFNQLMERKLFTPPPPPSFLPPPCSNTSTTAAPNLIMVSPLDCVHSLVGSFKHYIGSLVFTLPY